MVQRRKKSYYKRRAQNQRRSKAAVYKRLFLFGYFFRKKIEVTIAVTIIAMIFAVFKLSAKLFLSFKMYVAQTAVINIAGVSETQ